MEFFTADKYITLPRSVAFNRFLDDKNLKSFKTYLIWAIVFFAISLLANAIERFSAIVFIAISINLVFLLILRISYNRVLNSDNVRKFLYYYLVAQIIFGCLINFSHILSVHGNAETETGTETIQSDSSAGKDSLTIDTVSTTNKTETVDSANLKKSAKDTIWKNERGNFSVTVNLSQNYDSFAEWVAIISIVLVFFRFPRSNLYKIWVFGLILPIACELLIYGTLEGDSYIISGSFYIVLFFVSFFSGKRTRRKFNEQYDFYLKKNYESIRMKKELDSAKQIQLSMLPESDAVINGIEISGVSLPASEVGGDYFDYFEISKSKTGIFICDVSGHGVASGLLLSGLRSCMQLILEDYKNPKDVMEKLNRMVRKTQNRKMFVTAIFAVIDTEKNECELFNAGHLPPYKVSGSAGEIFKIKKHGIALGAVKEISLGNNESEVVFDFNKGDKLVFYTDGLNEAMNPAMQEYGFHKIEGTVNNNTDKNPQELIKLLLEDIKNFTKGKQKLDDLTILIVKRN